MTIGRKASNSAIMESALLASFKGLEHRVVIHELEQASLADVLRILSSALAIEEESIKVILPGGKLLKSSNTTAGQTAKQAGERQWPIGLL